ARRGCVLRPANRRRRDRGGGRAGCDPERLRGRRRDARQAADAMTRVWLVAALVVGWLAPGAARADVERYAVIVGNNAGDSDEQGLRYAEDDARRIYEVLRELGGFRPENMLLLRAEEAESVRRSLISVNDRIRTRVANGAQSELLVYYSGHSDQS